MHPVTDAGIMSTLSFRRFFSGYVLCRLRQSINQAIERFGVVF